MLNSTPHRTSRRAAITAALALTAALAVPAGALAAAPPTIGPPTVIHAGQKTPIDVGGNHLHQHDVIRRGTELVRWPVVMHGASKALVTLACPTGTIHSGLGLQEGSDVAFAVNNASDYFKPTIDVRFYTIRNVPADGATGHVYALCRDTAIAPLAPLVESPSIRRAGQKSPVDIAGNHLHQGDTIRAGTQLLRYGVTLHGNSRRSVTLFCPLGTVHRGIGFAEGTKLSFALDNKYGRRTMRMHLIARPGVSAEGTKGSVYALCG
ncbi:MAG: hypothetical protein QOE11_83 [Solirubrobacteraceae bacterium]|jgi:hypothetical protein|nr:hypothetical protein [Solirubrobacteraceae bacterium]